MKAIVALLSFVLALSTATVASAHDMGDMDMSGAGSSDSAMAAMGKHLMETQHMTMTQMRPMTAGDQKRANEIIATMRAKLSKYQDYRVAEADGYKPYMEQIPQEVYHFASRAHTGAEYAGEIDLERPGSLLYEKMGNGGWKLVGAMYSAPAYYTPEQLDAIVPLGIARWHEHTNICLPEGITEADVIQGRVMPPRGSLANAIDTQRGWNAGTGARMRFGYLADPRFGFAGTISTQEECEAVRGNFHKQIFGWMVHVYPFAGDDMKVAFGMDAP